MSWCTAAPFVKVSLKPCGRVIHWYIQILQMKCPVPFTQLQPHDAHRRADFPQRDKITISQFRRDAWTQANAQRYNKADGFHSASPTA